MQKLKAEDINKKVIQVPEVQRLQLPMPEAVHMPLWYLKPACCNIYIWAFLGFLMISEGEAQFPFVSFLEKHQFINKMVASSLCYSVFKGLTYLAVCVYLNTNSSNFLNP